MTQHFTRWRRRAALYLVVGLLLSPTGMAHGEPQLCLDGFCIGQGIADARFEQTTWLVPKQNVVKAQCVGVGCQPAVAFRGYVPEDQSRLTDAVSLTLNTARPYTIITNENLPTLRKYRYECNLSAGGLNGERRFVGFYRSVPSRYLTVVGLRLIGGQLTVYRIAREFPIHNQGELLSLAKSLRATYGDRITFVDYLSSNAYPEVIERRTDGWFGRSRMFNPSDMSDNAAELVLVDPRTRALLEPSSMPDSGEIKPLPMRLPQECSRSVPIQ